MSATILKANFIVTILEQLFFKTPLGRRSCYILLIQLYLCLSFKKVIYKKLQNTLKLDKVKVGTHAKLIQS